MNLLLFHRCLSVGAVHQYLVGKRIRTQAGLVVEAGDAWEVHHFATIVGYGASAVNPYLALETIHFMNKHDLFYKPLTDEEAYAELSESDRQWIVEGNVENGHQYPSVVSIFADL